MNRTEITPEFFAKEFHSDLEALESVSEENFESILAWLATYTDAHKFGYKETWAEVSQKTKLSTEDIDDIISPGVLIAYKLRNSGDQLGGFVEELQAAKLLSEFKDPEKLKKRLLQLVERINGFISHLPLPPGMALPRIRSIFVGPILTVRFDQTFQVGLSEKDSYSPKVMSLFPIITLELTLSDNARDVQIALSQNDLDQLRERLDVAAIELRSLAETTKQADIIFSK